MNNPDKIEQTDSGTKETTRPENRFIELLNKYGLHDPDKAVEIFIGYCMPGGIVDILCDVFDKEFDAEDIEDFEDHLKRNARRVIGPSRRKGGGAAGPEI
jgi:hypothetical protein